MFCFSRDDTEIEGLVDIRDGHYVSDIREPRYRRVRRGDVHSPEEDDNCLRATDIRCRVEEELSGIAGISMNDTEIQSLVSQGNNTDIRDIYKCRTDDIGCESRSIRSDTETLEDNLEKLSTRDTLVWREFFGIIDHSFLYQFLDVGLGPVNRDISKEDIPSKSRNRNLYRDNT